MKVALIQQAYHGGREATIARSRELVTEAGAQGAELVIMQELHTSEYFCQSEEVQFFDYGANYERDVGIFSALAKEVGIVLVGSFFERRSAGLYHNTAVVFEKDGTIAGRYRKMHIPDDPGFYEKFYFTPGDLGFEPIRTSVGNLGVLICWDQWYPEAARLMALKGAEILIYPTAIGWFDTDSKEEKERQKEAWIAVQRGHAVANGLPVVAVNRVGFEHDPSGVTAGIRFWGQSFAFGAQGEPLALGSVDEEEVIIIEIDRARSEEVRRMWPFLRDRRIDSYGGLLKRFLD
ncbi:MAG: carbon-nitrogen hydrolase [Wolinella sp.]